MYRNFHVFRDLSTKQLLLNVVTFILLTLLAREFLRRVFPSPVDSASAATDMASEENANAPPRPVTLSELSSARGEGDQPLYIAVKDPFDEKVTVFDVSSGKDFYGPGSGYHVFAGRDATYCLATTSLDASKLGGDLSTLSAMQKDTHLQWYNKYMSKYPVVGYLVPDDYSTSGTDSNISASAEDSKKDT